MEMTQAEYARHRGVSKQAISKALAAGKIPFREQNGVKLIDVERADLARGETIERVMARDDDAGDQQGGQKNSDDRRAVVGESGGALTRAKTETEEYRSRLARLDYETRVGKLVAIEDVTRSMEKCAGVFVRHMDQLPNFAEELAAAMARDGIAAVRVALKEIARKVRIAVSDNMRIIRTEQDHSDELESS